MIEALTDTLVITLLHPDVSALRRYFVDAGLMTREQGIYRRAAPVPSDASRPDSWPELSTKG